MSDRKELDQKDDYIARLENQRKFDNDMLKDKDAEIARLRKVLLEGDRMYEQSSHDLDDSAASRRCSDSAKESE